MQTVILWAIVLSSHLVTAFRYGHNSISAPTQDGDFDDWQLESKNEIHEIPEGLAELKGFPGFRNFTNNLSPNYLMKRYDHNLKHSCSCDTKPDEKTFSDDVWPRSYPTKICNWEKINEKTERTCIEGKECKEFYHKILVLKKKKTDTIIENTHDLPRQIRQHFYYDTEVSLHFIDFVVSNSQFQTTGSGYRLSLFLLTNQPRKYYTSVTLLFAKCRLGKFLLLELLLKMNRDFVKYFRDTL